MGSNGEYAVTIEALFVGREEDDSADFHGFDKWFKDTYPVNLIESSETTFDTFLEKLLAQVCSNLVHLLIFYCVKSFLIFMDNSVLFHVSEAGCN